MKYNKYLDLFLEKFYSFEKFGKDTIEVFKNPDTDEVNTAFGELDSVRGIIDANTDDLYIWHDLEGDAVLHGTMIEHMGWETKLYLPISIEQTWTAGKKRYIKFASWEYKASPLRKKYPYDPDEGKSDAIDDLIRNTPNVKSLGYRLA